MLLRSRPLPVGSVDREARRRRVADRRIERSVDHAHLRLEAFRIKPEAHGRAGSPRP
jgi:hypothetical protein